MAASKKNDFWDNALYLGLFILILAFLYQLMKLWNSGVASVSNIPGAIGQALTNTAAAIEGALSGLVTSPLSALSSIFSAVPDFFTSLISFITGIFSGITGAGSTLIAGTASLGSVFGSAAAPIDVGLGSSYSGTLPASATSTAPPAVGTTTTTPTGFYYDEGTGIGDGTGL